jgi:hypothetical protein
MDIEIAFCTYRGAIEEIIEQLERITRYEIPLERRQAIVACVLSTVEDELATAGARWTPIYDAMLRDVLATREAMEAVLAPIVPPYDEYGYWVMDTVAIDIARHRLAAYARVQELLAHATGPMLSDAWSQCADRDDVIAFLEVARTLDDDGIRERLRRAIVDELQALPSCDCAPVIESALLRAARVADWETTARLLGNLEVFPHVRGPHCRSYAICAVSRWDSSFRTLAHVSEIMTYDALMARFGNPFAPAVAASQWAACDGAATLHT